MQHQEVGGLSDIGGVDQVVVGVLVFAVAALQSLNKLHQSLQRDLDTVTEVCTRSAGTTSTVWVPSHQGPKIPRSSTELVDLLSH